MVTSKQIESFGTDGASKIEKTALSDLRSDQLANPTQRGTAQASPSALLFLYLLVQHRKALFAVSLAGLVISTLVAFLLPVRYEATARLMPPDQSSLSGNMLAMLTAKAGDTLGSAAGDALGLRTAGATTIGILNSRTVADDLINQFDLRKVYSKKLYQDARQKLAQRTVVSEDRKSGIITIAVQDQNPKRAADLARGYVEDLNRRVAQLTTSAAHRERVFLEERLKEVKQQLDEASAKLGQFSSKNRTFDPQVQGKAMLDAAAALQGQLIAAETELSGLQQIYGSENSRLRSASARVAELRRKLQSLGGSGSQISNGETGLSGGELYPSLEQLPILGNTYYDLARRAKINESVYEALTKQYELAKVQEAKEIPSVKILDEPVSPERKVWPPRTLIIFLGTLAALTLGLAYQIARTTWSQRPADDPYRLALASLKEATRLPAVPSQR